MHRPNLNIGNIRERKLGARIVSIEYDGQNRVSRAKDTANGNVWWNYSHDARGNVIDDARHGFGYDLSNQPTSISGDDSGSYVYDGNLKRVKQVVGGKTIYSVYNRAGQMLHRDNVSDAKETDYISVSGMSVAKVVNDVPEYLFTDHLGSPIMGAKADRTIVWKEQFAPFGEKLANPAAAEDNVGFTGHIQDSTGLTYMQARYYDPVIGRFLSKDPVGFTAGGTDYFNRYAYVGNDPVNGTDPTGLEKQTVTRDIVRTGSNIKKSYSVTVEAGDLSQTETAAIMEPLGDQFFTDNDGRDISSLGKPVEGDDAVLNTTASIGSQVVGGQIGNRGKGAIVEAWQNVKKIIADPNYIGFAKICAMKAGCVLPPYNWSIIFV